MLSVGGQCARGSCTLSIWRHVPTCRRHLWLSLLTLDRDRVCVRVVVPKKDKEGRLPLWRHKRGVKLTTFRGLLLRCHWMQCAIFLRKRQKNLCICIIVLYFC